MYKEPGERGYEVQLRKVLHEYASELSGYEYKDIGNNVVIRSNHQRLDTAYSSFCYGLFLEFIGKRLPGTTRVFIKKPPTITKDSKGYHIEAIFNYVSKDINAIQELKCG